MELTLTLPSELGDKLRQLAADAGQDAKTFAIQTLEQTLRGPRTLGEILAPFPKQVTQSGMSDSELDSFYGDLREEFWQNRTDERL